MNRRGSRALARAVNRRSEEAAHRQGRNHQLAEVTSVDPFKATLLDNGLELEDGMLVLTQSVHQYHTNYGVKQGDNFVMHRLSGHWVVTDVVSDTPVGQSNSVVHHTAYSTD